MFPWNLFPFNKKINHQMGQLNPNDIDKFVLDVMNQTIPSQFQGMMNNQDWLKNIGAEEKVNPSHQPNKSIPYTVFETHHYVYIRIPIPSENWLKRIKLYYSSNQLIVDQIPDLEEKLTITLPVTVRKKGATTHYREDILEIRLVKIMDTPYSEIELNSPH